MSLNFTRKMFGGTPDAFRLSLVYQAGNEASLQPWRIPNVPCIDANGVAANGQSAAVLPLSPKGPSEANPAAPGTPGSVAAAQAAGGEASGNGSSASGGSQRRGGAEQVLLPGGTRVNVDWTSDDSERDVLDRLQDVQRTVQSLASKETVRLSIQVLSKVPGDSSVVPSSGIVSASSFGKDVHVKLVVETVAPKLRAVQAIRTSNSGTAPSSLVSDMLEHCPLDDIAVVKCSEGTSGLWFYKLDCWRTLSHLDLGGCGLTSLPSDIGALRTLKELLLNNNKLGALPKEIGRLKHLQVLIADDNQLSGIPSELRYCTALMQLSLESNKLITPVIDLRALKSLEVLRLHGNPLEFLPELSPAHQLRHLTLASVRLTLDESINRTEVSVTGAKPSARNSKLIVPLFQLLFRRSSCQHPILAGAIATLVEGEYCSVIAQDLGAIHQVILMALSDSMLVVQKACQTLELLASSSESTAMKLLGCDALQAMMSLMGKEGGENTAIQVASLRVVGSLAFASEAAAKSMISEELLEQMKGLIDSPDREVQARALETLGNLAFCPENRPMIANTSGILRRLEILASRDQVTRPRHRMPGVFKADAIADGALRALAVLGENELVRRCLGRPSLGSRRGLRILSMDGGGMKGLVTVRMIKELEARTGHSMYDMFDLICGTSTGGILAIALAIKDFDVQQLEEIYNDLGKKVFSAPNQKQLQNEQEQQASWRESLYSMYNSSAQRMRVAMYGCKHDASNFEVLLKDTCDIVKDGMLSNRLIDSVTVGGPKVFVVSTLVSVTPAQPFIFRNYEYPAEGLKSHNSVGRGYGSSKHELWQAIRASSAAPYYLDDFTVGEDRWQDGAVSANNPTMQAVREARALWPDTPIDCIVSLGCGTVPVTKRPKGMSSYLDTGNVLIDNACSVERVDESLEALCPLIPGMKYFRFSPVAEALGMELDSIDPAEHEKCLKACEKYIEDNQLKFEDAAMALLTGLEGLECRVEHEGLGSSKGLLVVECRPTDDVAASLSHHETTADTCAGQALFLKRLQLVPEGGTASTIMATTALAPATEVPCLHLNVPLSPPLSPSSGPPSPSGPSPFANASRQRWSSRRTSLSPAPAPEVQGLLHCVQSFGGQVGVIHLALHGHSNGPVIRWTHQILAVAEPSEEATALCEAAGAPDARTLMQAMQGKSNLHIAGTSTLTLLSQQTHQLQGTPISSYLFRKTSPAAHLTVAAVHASTATWRGKLVVLSCQAPQVLVQALLEARAKAVLVPCSDLGSSGLNPNDPASFFGAFYSALSSGHTLLRSLRMAEDSVPGLRDVFSLFHIQDGSLARAESLAPDVIGRI